ncbi:hypothetical protein Y032_0015g2643 [Ancylostoma ceylanicum]|uniref:Uncharacterized protein n=1 Tax=Ancylostoma ceylanicum TaxID=53326 RepID=A0A016V8T5_9BILA|nr:hypothetical protein Y032_0015g2643 [Ancylostoma ceylanicum]
MTERILKAVCQVVLGIKVYKESDSSRRADSNDVLGIRKKVVKNPTSKAKCDLDMDEFPRPQTRRER